MADPYVGEIRLFAGNFAPTNWALCAGQLLAIQQNTALFSLLGTYYGGDGKSTFALPDLRGHAPIHQHQGAGLTARVIGEQVGTETVSLIVSEMPNHTHSLTGSGSAGDTTNPNNAYPAPSSTRDRVYSDSAPTATNALPLSGGNLPHNNMMPYLVINYIICLQGVFPPRP